MKSSVIALLIILMFSVRSQSSVIRGVVVSADDGAALAGANIMITGTSIGAAADSDGRFRIDNVSAGSYKVKASFMGFYDASQKIAVGKNETVSVNFKLAESVFKMDAVVVTATRTEKALKDAPALTEIITRRQLETTGRLTVKEALDEMPALDFAPDSHGDNITMNGLGPKYVLFLIDGERIAGEVKGNVDFSRLNTSDIERIEILKGASSCLYGSNAIAGVVNIITRKVDKPLTVELHSRISKYNELGMGGSAGFRCGRLSSKTNVMHKRSDGYDLTPENVTRTVEEYNDLSIKQQFSLNPTEKVTINVGGGYFFHRKLEARRKIRNIYPKYYDVNYNIGVDYRVNRRLRLESGWHSDTYDTKDVMMLFDGAERLTYQNRNNTGRLMAHYTANDKNTISMGAEFMAEKVFSTRIFDETHRAQDWVLFMQDDIIWSTAWKFVPGFRLNNHSEYGAHFTPSISVMYQALPLNLRTTYARGFKAPTLKELYYNWDHGGGGPYVYGNPDLKPETSDYVSFSAEYISTRMNGSVSLFHTELKDMIDSRPEPGDPNVNYYHNIAQAMTQGVEILLKVDAGMGLAFSGGYSLVDTEDETTGNPLYGRARHSGTFLAEYRNPVVGFTFNLRGKFIGKKLWSEEVDATTNEVIKYEQSPYAIWRVTATQKVFAHLTFTFGVDNIFDYRDINYLITPGRVFYGGLNINYN